MRAPAAAKILKKTGAVSIGSRSPADYGTFAIVGWANKNGKFDGVYLCKTEDGALVYAGRLERDLSEKDKREMLKRLALHVHKQPMNAAPKRFPRLEGKSVVLAISRQDRRRLASAAAFKGFRDDLT